MTLEQIGKMVRLCYLRHWYRRVDTTGEWIKRRPLKLPAEQADRLRAWLRKRYP